MALNHSNESEFNQLLKGIEGTTVYTTCTLSATRENEFFWGVKLRLPTGKINSYGALIVLISKETFCQKFIDHLKVISKPFPLLMDKIKSFNFNFCGTDDEWENNIIQQSINVSHDIYLCDHCHCH